jgi:hypothetical protein
LEQGVCAIIVAALGVSSPMGSICTAWWENALSEVTEQAPGTIAVHVMMMVVSNASDTAFIVLPAPWDTAAHVEVFIVCTTC